MTLLFGGNKHLNIIFFQIITLMQSFAYMSYEIEQGNKIFKSKIIKK